MTTIYALPALRISIMFLKFISTAMNSVTMGKITQLLALSGLLLVIGVDSKVVVGTTRNEESNGTVTVQDIQDHNKTQYFNQNFEEGNYNYGYDIRPSGPNGQFHHENKAPDGVVYGCYGYLDPNNMAQITFYVSDAWGYRPVRQEQPVEVFFPAANPEGTTDMKGETIQWAELVFPEKCTFFAQQVAVAASSNVGQTLVGTPFSIAPGLPPFVSTPNRRPVTPNVSPFTTPIVVTPLGGTGNSRPSNEIRTPNPSVRTPSSIRPPSPTIQTPFAPVRNPTPAFIPFTSASTGNGATGSGTRNPAENGTQILTTNTTTISTTTTTMIPTTTATSTTTTTTTPPILTSTAAYNGSQGFGPDGTESNPGNGGSPGFGNNENGGFGNGGGPSTHGNGASGTTAYVENTSPGPNSLSNNNRRPGDFTGQPGDRTFPSTANGGRGNGASSNSGGRVTSPNNGFNGNSGIVTPTLGSGTGNNSPRTGTSRTPTANPNYSTNLPTTGGNKITNEFGSSKFPSSSAPALQNGGSTTFTGRPSQATGFRQPTDNSNGGLPTGGQQSSFYTEGSSSSIYPNGNHVATEGPGSQPSSSNNVGETLEQEVEGSSSAIFPGRKQSSDNGNKSGALKTLPNGGNNASNNPSGNSRTPTSQSPPFQGSFQTATGRPTENPNKGNSRNNEQNRPNNSAGNGFGNSGTPKNQGTFANQPSRASNEKFDRTPGFTASPRRPSPSSSEEFSEIYNNSNKYDSSASCPQICNSCNANRQPSPDEIDYSQIPGAIVANIPVVFYPDCSANAFSRPAVVPFCPSKQQTGCSNQPLTMKFPPVSAYSGNSNGPAARNAFASSVPSRTSRRIIRKTRHSHTENM